EAGIALYDRARDGGAAFLYGQDPGVSCLGYLAVVLWHLGLADEAVATSERAIALARDLDHPFSLAFALDMAAAVRQFRREPAETAALADAAVALATDRGFPLWATYGTVLRGWARVLDGRGGDETAAMRDGIAAWRATGARVVGPYLLGMLAEAYATIGRRADAHGVLEEARAMATASG